MMQVNERFLTTQQVAEILSLSVSTVKRLVETGEIVAIKTPGGHRRIAESVIDHYARNRGIGLVEQSTTSASISHATGKLKAVDESVDYWRTALKTALVQSHIDEARHAVRTVYASCGDASVLADTLISPVMLLIGHAWQEGRIEIFQEHHACHILSDILYELVRQTRNRNRRSPLAEIQPLAIGATPEGDHYTLTGMLCELTLLERRWEVRNLGCHLPVPELAQAITDLKPKIAWLSVHHLENEQTLITDLKKLLQTARMMKTTLILGGQGLNENIRKELDQLHVTPAQNMDYLAVAAEKIFPGGRCVIDSLALPLHDLHNSR
jgi:excisionase family DNA binding protein